MATRSGVKLTVTRITVRLFSGKQDGYFVFTHFYYFSQNYIEIFNKETYNI